MMKGKRVIILLLVVSVLFNITFISIQTMREDADPQWIFPELGPAVIQDSAFGRSPVLESPIGIIGDLPGGYSLYNGNPLQTGNLTIPIQYIDESVLVIIVVLGVIPTLAVFIMGRRSYGSSKTQ